MRRRERHGVLGGRGDALGRLAFGLTLCVLGCDVAEPGPTREPLVVLSSSPAEGAIVASGKPVFRARFNRRLFPSTVNRRSVRVISGDYQGVLSVRFDPIESEVQAELLDTEDLIAGVTYRFILGSELEDFEGNHIDEPLEIHFEVTEGAPESFFRRDVSFAEVAPIFEEACATSGCHDANTRAVGLDLSTEGAVRETAVGATSREFPTTPEGFLGVTSFAGMRLVDVIGDAGRPEYSYLMYKVLGDPHVFGTVMPPTTFTRQLSDDEIETLGAWIYAGAK